MKITTTIYKMVDGIKYFSNRVDITCCYRLWESNSHPSYKHWEAIKNKKEIEKLKKLTIKKTSQWKN